MVSVEAIGALGLSAGAAWSGFSEVAPPLIKGIGNAIVGAIGAIGGIKLWRDSKRERKKQ